MRCIQSDASFFIFFKEKKTINPMFFQENFCFYKDQDKEDMVIFIIFLGI